MTFKSRKDSFFTIVIYSVILLLCFLLCISLTKENLTTDTIVAIAITLASIIFIVWIFHGTCYEITESTLKYKSGPIRGEIKIKQITKIIKGKTMWVGLKPSTAKNGLIIKYDTYNEIYISPDTNELFIKEILKQNNTIIIE